MLKGVKETKIELFQSTIDSDSDENIDFTIVFLYYNNLLIFSL